ncbi:MAG: hypothetical protein OIF32_04580, partial [Campylobacterales bacterium]|nr:hypothetical protein [Campylobacterales bacterium]
DVYQGAKKDYISNRTMINLQAEDFAGIQGSYFYINKRVKSNCNSCGKAKPKYRTKKAKYENGISAKDLMIKLGSKKKGQLTLGYRSLDKVGNLENKNYKKLTLDTVAPKSSAKFIGDHIYKGGIHYVSDRTKLRLSAKDNLSGVQKINYVVNGKNTEYTSAIRMGDYKDLQKFQLNYSSTDNVNNQSFSKELRIKVDKLAPKLFNHYSYQGKEAQNVQLQGDKEKIFTSPVNTKLYMAAEDDIIGVKNIYFSINGGKQRAYKEPIKFTKPGTYEISISVVDRLNNKEKITSKIRVVSSNDKRIIENTKLKVDYKEKW